MTPVKGWTENGGNTLASQGDITLLWSTACFPDLAVLEKAESQIASHVNASNLLFFKGLIFKVISTPSMGLEPTTPRSRITRSAN